MLHSFSNFLVGSNERFGSREFSIPPLVQVRTHAERALHGREEAVWYGRASGIDPVRRVSDPGHHHSGRVRVGEPVLNAQSVEWVSVVGRPDLVGKREYPEV